MGIQGAFPPQCSLRRSDPKADMTSQNLLTLSPERMARPLLGSTSRLMATLTLGMGLALSQAATAASATPENETVAPPAPMLVQGVPPVPASLARSVARYNDFRGHGFVDWHPQRREMVVSHRQAGASTAQLYRLREPMGTLEPLTDAAEPVTQAQYEPQRGEYLVFSRASGGNEAYQLYRLDLATRTVTLLTSPEERHSLAGWLRGNNNSSSRILVSSVPLDRTATGGRRSEIQTTFSVLDPLQPQARRVVASLPGGGWFAGDVSADGQWASLTRYLSANESQTWLMNLETGERRQLLPQTAAGDKAPERAVYLAGAFSADGRQLFVLSDRHGEFREMLRVDIASGAATRITGHIPWDISGGSATRDGRLLALQANVDGQDQLRLFDGERLQELPAPALPAGNIGITRFDTARGELAFTLNSAQGPSQIYTLEPGSGRVQQWTRAEAPAGVDPSAFTPQQIVRWKSFDGRTISGLLTMPPARFAGKRPVIISIHGGPESQSTMGFLGRNQYFVQEMGIAFLQPNVRGSSGYGKTFLALDNGRLREDSVKDIGALLDWIATQPGLDASRVLVTGGSYGGYMSLAVSTHYADRIAGSINVVGISHFVTFLNNTESYRRDLRRVEYGDERDPAMREFLDRISPLTNAHKIRKPLMVVQGKNDPRVPYTEAEQIVEKVRANGTPVWYLRADNEGHGFARKENADYQFFATLLFLQQTLLR